MTTTREKISFVDGQGIYYVNKLSFVLGQGTLTCEYLVFTDDPDLIDTLVPEITAHTFTVGAKTDDFTVKVKDTTFTVSEKDTNFEAQER